MATFSTGGDMPNYFSTGGDNMGLGGGLLGTLLAVSLLGRGGLGGWGGWGNGQCATGEPPVTQSDLNGMTLGDIKASIPFNEAQVQLAISNAVSMLNGQINAGNQALGSQIGQTALANAQGFANNALGIANVSAEIARESNVITNAITSDGQKTRELITNNMIAELNSRNVILANEISDLKASAERSDAHHATTIAITNNQNQNQLQFQQQAQVLNQLTGVLAGMQQSIHATNQAINIGSGTQRANPTNNNTNVTA